MARKPTFPVSAIPAQPAAPEPEIPSTITITNTRPGFTLHLGDGRQLAFGESADVPAYMADAFNG